jgi:hypothetical protein
VRGHQWLAGRARGEAVGRDADGTRFVQLLRRLSHNTNRASGYEDDHRRHHAGCDGQCLAATERLQYFLHFGGKLVGVGATFRPIAGLTQPLAHSGSVCGERRVDLGSAERIGQSRARQRFRVRCQACQHAGVRGIELCQA